MNDDIEFITDSHYYVCSRCRHMFILKSFIEEFCITNDSILEIRDFCNSLLDKNSFNDLHKKGN